MKQILLAFVLTISACAGRPPQPMAVVQPQDHTSTCAEIMAEGKANNHKIEDLAGEQGAKVAQNVAAGIVGVFVWPVLFAMDFQGSASREIEALQERQQYLGTLAVERECGNG